MAATASNIASGMVEKGSPYTAIVIPLGLLQILNNGTDVFDPNSDKFDPVRAVEGHFQSVALHLRAEAIQRRASNSSRTFETAN